MNESKLALKHMIIEQNAPQSMHLTILNDALDLFENDAVIFDINEIYEYINTANEIEDYIKFNSGNLWY